MAKKILFEDLVPYPEYLSGMQALEAANKQFGDNAVKINSLLGASLEGLKKELNELRDAVIGLNGAAGKNDLPKLRDDSEGAANKLTALQKAIERNRQAMDLNSTAITGLQKRMHDLQTEYNSLDRAEAKSVARMKEIEAEAAKLSSVTTSLNTVVRQAAKATEDQLNSYNRLSRQTNALRTSLKNLDNAFDLNTGAINKNNKQAVEYQKQIEKNDAALKKMDASMGLHQRNVGNYGNVLKEVGGSMLGFSTAAGAVLAAFAAIGASVDVITQAERSSVALKAVSRDSADFARSQQFLTTLANKLGVQYGTLVNTYKSLKAATKDTALEGRETEKIYASIVTAGAKLQLSNEDIEGSLRAVSKMVSSGNIQMDELRSELGERLPGALRIMSEALGISQSQLNKMVEQGQILAVDVLPKFGEALGKTFGLKQNEEINTITASVNRLKNEFTFFLTGLNESKAVQGFFKALSDGLVTSLGDIRRWLKDGSVVELFTVFGSGSLTAKNQERATNEAFLNQFGGKDAKQRAAEIARVQKDEQAKEAAGITDGAETLYKLRMKMMKQHNQLLNQESQDNKRQQVIKEKTAIEKNETDLTRFQKQAVRKRTAEILALEKKLAADPKNEVLQKKLEVYNRLDAEQKKRDAEVSSRLKSEKGASASSALTNALSVSKAGTGAKLSGLSNDKQDGLISEAAFIEQRKQITLAGIAEREAILTKAGKKESDDFKVLAKEKLDAEGQYKRDSLKLALSDSKGNTATALSGLGADKEDGTISEVEFVEKRKQITLAGIAEQRKILADAGQTDNKLTEDLNKQQLDAEREYFKDRLKVQLASWKIEQQTTKDQLTKIDQGTAEFYQEELVKIQQFYDKQRIANSELVANGSISQLEGEKRSYMIDLAQLKEEMQAAEDAYERDRLSSAKLIDDKIAKLEEYKAAAIRTPKEILEAEKQIAALRKQADQDLADDKKRLDKEVADNAIAQSKKEAEEHLKNLELQRKAREQAADVYVEAGTTLVNGIFAIEKAQTDIAIGEIDKRQQYEQDSVGNNQAAKAAIQKKYDAERKALQKQQDRADQRQALFNVGISTAMAVAKTYAEFGFPFGVPLALAQAALGAVQAGVILATPLPQYKDGKNLGTLGKQDKYEGLAIAGEAGSEIWSDGKNTKLLTEPTLINVGANDQILPNYLTEQILEANNLSNRTARQISDNNVMNRNRSLAKDLQMRNALRLENSSIKDLGKEIGHQISKMPFNYAIFDEDGVSNFTQSQSQKVTNRNNKHTW